jgi:hypothetical protein
MSRRSELSPRRTGQNCQHTSAYVSTYADVYSREKCVPSFMQLMQYLTTLLLYYSNPFYTPLLLYYYTTLLLYYSTTIPKPPPQYVGRISMITETITIYIFFLIFFNFFLSNRGMSVCDLCMSQCRTRTSTVVISEKPSSRNASQVRCTCSMHGEYEAMRPISRRTCFF